MFFLALFSLLLAGIAPDDCSASGGPRTPVLCDISRAGEVPYIRTLDGNTLVDVKFRDSHPDKARDPFILPTRANLHHYDGDLRHNNKEHDFFGTSAERAKIETHLAPSNVMSLTAHSLLPQKRDVPGRGRLSPRADPFCPWGKGPV